MNAATSSPSVLAFYTISTVTYIVWQFKLAPFLQWSKLAFKRINGTLPHYLNTSLRQNSDNHARITRNCNLNLLSPCHKNILEVEHTFALRTAKDWNNLPRTLTTKKTLKYFKSELWKVILNFQKINGSFDINNKRLHFILMSINPHCP